MYMDQWRGGSGAKMSSKDKPGDLNISLYISLRLVPKFIQILYKIFLTHLIMILDSTDHLEA